ncbi:unnamed protein product [Linum trigynum]|uniref:Uncharacterized protein n=1 Tax=Linum trigynum TaxID=586398 RepID=A0AAV2DDC1_9ROSI
MLKIESRFNFQELCDICADRVCTSGHTRLGKISYRYPDISAGGVVYQEVVINDDDAVTMMLQFLSDNVMRLAKPYVETEVVGETHSHQYSYDDGFAGGYRWGGSSSNYEGGGYTGGYGEGGSSSNYGGCSSAGWVVLRLKGFTMRWIKCNARGGGRSDAPSADNLAMTRGVDQDNLSGMVRILIRTNLEKVIYLNYHLVVMMFKL